MKNMLEEIGYNMKDVVETLEKNYEEALKNENFYELVSKLNYPKKELMKYTSRLEDCAKEYEHCKYCKSLLECQNTLSGYAYLPCVRDRGLNFEYQMCRYRKKIEENSKYLNNITIFEGSEELKKTSMKEIDVKDKNRHSAIKWIQNFIKSYEKNPYQKGLYLYGNFGVGKSYFISALFNELAKKDVKSVIVFWPDFLRSLKFSVGNDYKNKAEFMEKYEKVRKAPLLLIDDIGAEVTTEWGRDEIFCPLVQYRMEQKLPTFIRRTF